MMELLTKKRTRTQRFGNSSGCRYYQKNEKAGLEENTKDMKGLSLGKSVTASVTGDPISHPSRVTAKFQLKGMDTGWN